MLLEIVAIIASAVALVISLERREVHTTTTVNNDRILTDEDFEKCREEFLDHLLKKMEKYYLYGSAGSDSRVFRVNEFRKLFGRVCRDQVVSLENLLSKYDEKEKQFRTDAMEFIKNKSEDPEFIRKVIENINKYQLED